MDFTRETIVEALSELGEALWRRKTIADISIFRGSAMFLQSYVWSVTPLRQGGSRPPA